MKPLARKGDAHDCPAHGKNEIVTGGRGIIDGRPVARVGDVCACGGTIVQGSSQAAEDGRPLAYLGCATSCGGVISSGAPYAKVTP